MKTEDLISWLKQICPLAGIPTDVVIVPRDEIIKRLEELEELKRVNKALIKELGIYYY